ncbi:dihydroxyacetone kinase subunit DhaL [Propionibacteriaceae bacterium G1746]|uniref:dihydroxyacetone kinase subunit DhaL n=1 Tax=Aestuariimicrobium sp. G57 TaxID=3418485 RepID=UPI003C280A9C
MTALSDAEFVVRTVADTACANEEYFGQLDAVVGDGDFGYSLARGFEHVLAQWDDFDRTDAGVFLQKVAQAISQRVGGTSGPIWGTAFLRAGGKLKGHETIAPADVVVALRAAVEGIQARGQAQLGEKTLLDSLVPAIDTFEAETAAGASTDDALAAMAVTARTTADATKELQAMRGRASYTGERSIGSVDAGATAVAVMLEKLAGAWPQR